LNARRGVAIGVDAGASTTLALLVDEECEEVRRATAGGANIRVSGRERTASELRKAIETLASDSPDLLAVCVGAAGSDRGEDRNAIDEIVRAIVPNSTGVLICHDGRIALEAFTEDRPALAIIAGTGSFVYGEDRQRRGVRGGGWGPVIGDPGSGYSLGLAAIRHLAKTFDGTDAPDEFAGSIAARLGVDSSSDLIELVQRWPPDVVGIADLARLVGDACSRDSGAARAIVDAEANALFSIASGVARAIGGGSDRMQACLTGGAFLAVPELARSVAAHMNRAGHATSRLTVEPALGAARLALCIRSKG
jgi:N-acetylglucosamine kinase-like BadF-type ATPase